MTLDDIKIALKSVDLRVTSKRIDVISSISNYSKAISYGELQNNLVDFDRVTLYRTLQKLTECGIIHVAMIDEHETYYAIKHNTSSSVKEYDHLHFKCKKCNEVSCVHPQVPINTFIPGYSIDNISIKIIGVCSKCN